MEQLNWEKYKSNEITHSHFWRGALPGLPQGQQCNQCQPLSWTVFEDQYRGRTQEDLTSSHSLLQQHITNKQLQKSIGFQTRHHPRASLPSGENKAQVIAMGVSGDRMLRNPHPCGLEVKIAEQDQGVVH